MANPFQLAEALKQQKHVEFQRANKFPNKPIFGGDSPKSLSMVTPYEERKYM